MLTRDRTDKSDTPRCAQCGGTTPEHGFTEKVVIHRDWDDWLQKGRVVQSRFTVCRGTACGAHLQMAYEG